MTEIAHYRALILLAAICALAMSALIGWACVLVFALGFASGGLYACVRMMEGGSGG